MKSMLLGIVLSAVSLSASATSTLTINAAEFGIGKFHRYDNKQHAYEKDNAWSAFILPEGVSTKKALVKQTDTDNYTVFYTNLEELMQETVKLAKSTGKQVRVFNINAHGLPGGMWFPKDAKNRDSLECFSWREAADNDDKDNYDQYYSPVEKNEILDFNRVAEESKIPGWSCLTGINEWTAVLARNPEFKTIFTNDAQVHMLSCIVGMGTLGNQFTTGLAKLLFKNGTQQVQTSLKFGLGDWSMPEGMGFWGFISDEQLNRDNEHYPIDRRDADQAQTGDIRVAQVQGDKILSGLMKDQHYLVLSHDGRNVDFDHNKSSDFDKGTRELALKIRIPGTKVYVQTK